MNGMARVGCLIFFLFAVSSLVSGKLSDRWIAAGASTTRVRKTMLGGGSIGLGLALVVAAVAPDTIFVWAMSGAGIFLGMSGGCCWTVTQTLAGPQAAGRWAGVQNFVGNLAGWVAPALTGYLVGRTGLFYWPFVIAAGVSWVGALSWVLAVGPIEPVDWSRNSYQPGLRIRATPTPDVARP
jgi:MFS family permease